MNIKMCEKIGLPPKFCSKYATGVYASYTYVTTLFRSVGGSARGRLLCDGLAVSRGPYKTGRDDRPRR